MYSKFIQEQQRNSTSVNTFFQFSFSKDILDSTDKEWRDVDAARHDFRTGNVNVNSDSTKDPSNREENRAG